MVTRGLAPRFGALDVAVLVFALLAIAGALFAPASIPLHYVFKPATTLLLIAIAWRSIDACGFRAGVLVGLGFSLLGDVALMLPVDAFAVGLGAFLLAHLAYIAAFRRHATIRGVIAAGTVYALIATGLLSVLLPQVPPALRWPVLAYVVVLVGMAAFAFSARGTGGSRLALGGALFVLSDSLLAWNRFVEPVPFSPIWVLASYWAAQWCIARSVAGRGTHG